MNEWRELTGDALNFYVAERRGDVVKHAIESFDDWGYDAESETWLNHWIEDADGTFGSARPVPDVAGDLNAALALPHGDSVLLKLEEWARVSSKNEWLAMYYDNRAARGNGFWADTPALAICYAWLSLLDWSEGRK